MSPDVTIALAALTKSPGEEMVGNPVELLATHHSRAGEMDAYERLLGDAMRGDPTLFAREDYVEAAWKIVDPILGNKTPLFFYEPNTWGPRKVESRIVPPRGWHDPQVSAPE